MRTRASDGFAEVVDLREALIAIPVMRLQERNVIPPLPIIATSISTSDLEPRAIILATTSHSGRRRKKR